MTSNQYWVDDLPLCKLAASGMMSNQQNDTESPIEIHEYEDRKFHFTQNGIGLYGVFNGHSSSKAANFAYQKLPADLILDSDNLKFSDDKEVETYIKNAFVALEHGFLDTMDEKLARRYQLKQQLLYANSENEKKKISSELVQLENSMSGGTQATIALVKDHKLFVANVGCSRAVYCTFEDSNQLNVKQITNEHNLKNINELKRLARCDVNIEGLCHQDYVYERNGMFLDCTRCIGDFWMKKEAKALDILKSVPNREATTSPIIADPEVDLHYINSTCPSFLILMTDGVYKALQNATGDDECNSQIAEMILQEFVRHDTMNGVCQAVLQKIADCHRETFMRLGKRNVCTFREDMTLLIRYFDCYTSNDSCYSFDPSKSQLANRLKQTMYTTTRPLRLKTISNISTISDNEFLMTQQSQTTLRATAGGNSGEYDNVDRANTNDTTVVNTFNFHEPFSKNQYEYDADGNVIPYVDFADYDKFLENLDSDGKHNYEEALIVKVDLEDITEENVNELNY